MSPSALEAGAVYTGMAPYASCHYQCLANVLEAQGMPDAEARLCMTWGFAWEGGERLHGSGRWMATANRVHGVDLAEQRFPAPEAAFATEAELFARGEAFVVGVDTYAIPSAHTGTAHVPHSVIVLGTHRKGVVILDPMNLPEKPSWYACNDYRAMRAHPCVEGTVVFTSGAAPSRDPDDAALLATLLADIDEHWAADLAAFDAYVRASDRRAGIDVCRTGAERLYLSLLLRYLARNRPALAPVAQGTYQLARRWYLIHTMAQQGGDRVRSRCETMVAGMRRRECALRDQLIAIATHRVAVAAAELMEDVL